MIQIRLLRGSAEESKATMKVVSTKLELLEFLIQDQPEFTALRYNDLIFRLHDPAEDERLGWPCTWFVLDENQRPLALCSGDPSTLEGAVP